MDLVNSYLDRLGVQLVARRDIGFLRELQTAHLQRIPFENLSNHLGEPLSLEPDALSRKILERHRGGFCYELNGLFSMLLEQLGYEVELLGAMVWSQTGFGPPLDHLVLRVVVPDADPGSQTCVDSGPRQWLVDVGFGMHSVQPLPWEVGVDHKDPGGVFRLAQMQSGDWDLYRDGKVQYRIEPNRRVLADFEAMCWYHQHAPNSHFTQSLVCSRLTADGRVTLSGRRLITSTAAGRQESEIEDDQELLAIYRTRFGVELERLPAIPS